MANSRFSPTFPIYSHFFNYYPIFCWKYFWPDPLTFTATSPANTSPYTADLTVHLDRNTFGISDSKGLRVFQIKGCIVVRQPYIGTLNYANDLIVDNLNGTLNVEGGLVYESDGTTPFKINNKQATLNTFIHQSPTVGQTIPTSDDSIVLTDISFVWKPNVAALAGHNLTTIGCIPSVSIEKTIQNSIITAEGLDPAAVKLPPFPDIEGAQTCVANALAAFRKNITLDTAATFQAAAISCLTNLQNQTSTMLCAAIIAGTSAFKSTITTDVDIQFISRPINVSVILNDPSGTTLSNNIPASCVPVIEEKIIGTVTLGKITPFTYDGYTQFNAQITSSQVGSGELNVAFNGKVFNTIIVPTTTGINTSIIENILSYQFIDASIDTPVRRDETDVSRIEES